MFAAFVVLSLVLELCDSTLWVFMKLLIQVAKIQTSAPV